MKFPIGLNYEGEMKNGLRHGYQSFENQEGFIYNVFWDKDVYHGHGKVIGKLKSESKILMGM